jgi:hypothetical protein
MAIKQLDAIALPAREFAQHKQHGYNRTECPAPRCLNGVQLPMAGIDELSDTGYVEATG